MIFAIVCAGLVGLLPAAVFGQGEARVVYDFVERFEAGQSRENSACHVRPEGSAGGVKKPSIYLHPRTPAAPAELAFKTRLPVSAPGEFLLLGFSVALADGANLGQGDDGVRFEVAVGEEVLFSLNSREQQWRYGGVDLARFAGQEVAIRFLSHANRNTSYDWALWGDPVIYHFSANSKTPWPAVQPAAFAASDIVALPSADQKVWTLRHFEMAVDFDAFTRQLEQQPVFYLSANFAPELKLEQLSPGSPIIGTGDPIHFKSIVRNVGRGKSPQDQFIVEFRFRAQTSQVPLPALNPKQETTVAWNYSPAGKAAVPGGYFATARLRAGDRVEQQISAPLDLMPDKQRPAARIENSRLRMEFYRHNGGYAYAKIFGRSDGTWKQTAIWSPLFAGTIHSDKMKGLAEWRPRPRQFKDLKGYVWEISDRLADVDGQWWSMALRIELPPQSNSALVTYTWIPESDREIYSLWGPNIYALEGERGLSRIGGLFPGLEYLFADEISSNPRDFAPPLADRRTPHPHKVTIPLMAVTLAEGIQASPGPRGRFYAPDSLKDRGAVSLDWPKIRQSQFTLSLSWDPFQPISPRFSSPNRDENMNNHRLGLFFPNVPDHVKENENRASQPYLVRGATPARIAAELSLASGPVLSSIRQWIASQGGLPEPNPWPRSFQQELDVCREGFLKTVWDANSEKWRHCIGWGASHSPGFATLLWFDSKLAEAPQAREASRQRVELAARNMLRENGPGIFASQANCHILQWEFPFHYGYLPPAVAAMKAQAAELIRSQREDGGWVYQPGNKEQAELGQAGDSVLGTCANRAATLLRFARIAGDQKAWLAGERALYFMEQFHVPRGGQTWECPMYEPDILAAAYAIKAYLDGYAISGNPRWLHNAVYWAETGVPFNYFWSLKNKLMMLGASIPVFGSTFYTHSWLAVPVQWCGLVYAYHVQHLAKQLRATSLAPTDSPYALSLKFTPKDWETIVQHLMVSAAWQQFADGDKVGAYPDSISNFEQKNPAFLNPEDILINVLALHGADPDIRTARLNTTSGEIVVSSGAVIRQLRSSNNGFAFQLDGFADEPKFALIHNSGVAEVKVNGSDLSRLNEPPGRNPGWWVDPSSQRLFLSIPPFGQVAEVEVIRAK